MKMPPKRALRKKPQHIGDVTIYDYANSTVATNRPKKSMTIQQTNIIDAANEKIDTEDHLTMESVKKPKNKKIQEVIDENDNNCRVYTIDIWFLISEYIAPEDVGRFALICQNTAAICSTYKFWSTLYKKYYKTVHGIPMRLQPECMERIGGMRACTIRSLFFTYQPCVDQLVSLANQDFHTLVKRECAASWIVQIKNQWLFCFKLKKKVLNGSRLDAAEKLLKSNKKLLILSDIYQNSEESCKILVIRTSNFCPMPQLFGQKTYLSSINQTLSQTLDNYKLKLTFVNYCQQTVASVVYDPVIKIEVLDWWTPAYYARMT